MGEVDSLELRSFRECRPARIGVSCWPVPRSPGKVDGVEDRGRGSRRTNFGSMAQAVFLDEKVQMIDSGAKCAATL